MTDIPKGYIKKKSVTVPFGYKLSNIQGYLAPISSQLEELNKTLHSIYNKEASLREAATLLSEKTGRKISHVSLKTYLDKDLWLIFPEEYVTDDNGEFVLTKVVNLKRKAVDQRINPELRRDITTLKHIKEN